MGLLAGQGIWLVGDDAMQLIADQYKEMLKIWRF
jgi:hypothetical protein